MRAQLTVVALGLLLLAHPARAWQVAHDVEVLQEACDSGSARMCNNLGVRYKKGQGVPRDLHRAAALYGQACDGGSGDGCSNLGALYRKGEGVPQDYHRAVALFRQACDGGSAKGCRNLAAMHRKRE